MYKVKIVGIGVVATLLLTSFVVAETQTSLNEKKSEPANCSLQPPIEWEKTYGGAEFDEFRGVQETIDGGYIICGSTEESDRRYPWVLKVDSDGNEVWEKTIEGFEYDGTYFDIADCYVDRIIQANDGGYILCFIPFVTYNELDYILGGIFKLDSNGGEEWMQIYGYGFEWTIYPQSLIEVDDGFMCVGAHSPPLYSPDTDRARCLFKIDRAGELIWHQEYNYGERPDWARDLCATDDDGFLIAGTVTQSEEVYYACIFKTNSLGAVEWTKLYIYGEDLLNVFQTSDGGYIAAGYANSHTDTRGDAWAVKIDSSGNEQWNKTFGGRKLDQARGLGITDDGGFIFGVVSNFMELSGTRDDIWIIKTDGEGNTEWSEIYGGSDPDGVLSLDTTSDGGFIVAGYSGPYFARPCDALLVKYAAFHNQRPDKPTRPSGPSRGRPDTEYIFTTSASDADGDQIYYIWDWGDGNFSNLLGPYGPGDICEVPYTWTGKNNYNIRVIAQDEHGGESDWSDPLSFSTPKNEFHLLFIGFLKNYPHLFPILRHILGL